MCDSVLTTPPEYEKKNCSIKRMVEQLFILNLTQIFLRIHKAYSLEDKKETVENEKQK